MAHGGARPGAGRKAGSKNSTPAKNVTSKSVCLSSNHWNRLADIAAEKGTTTTKLAALILTAWIDSK